MRPLSESARRVAGKNFEKKYVALGRIVNAWSDIVGQDFAQRAQPVQIQYRKRERSKTAEARLDIAVSSADATIMHYQKDLILERINNIFGERWITAIRFIHVPANAKTLMQEKDAKPLNAQEKNILGDILLAVKDADIRVQLEKIGQFIIRKDKT